MGLVVIMAFVDSSMTTSAADTSPRGTVSMDSKANERAGKVAAARKRKATASKDDAKRKRVGHSGIGTQQARTSRRAAAGTKQAKEADKGRLLREIRALAMGAIDALDDQNYESAREKLVLIAKRGDH
jgi:hypothetical protein